MQMKNSKFTNTVHVNYTDSKSSENSTDSKSSETSIIQP